MDNEVGLEPTQHGFAIHRFFPIYLLIVKIGTHNGIRTRAVALKGRCPRPTRRYEQKVQIIGN